MNVPAVFICLGYPPVAGCGKVLTAEERYYYECICEDCSCEWGRVIDAWRAGGENTELDAMFDDKPGAKEVN